MSAFKKLCENIKVVECDWCGKNTIEEEIYDISEFYLDDHACRTCLENEEYGEDGND